MAELHLFKRVAFAFKEADDAINVDVDALESVTEKLFVGTRSISDVAGIFNLAIS